MQISRSTVSNVVILIVILCIVLLLLTIIKNRTVSGFQTQEIDLSQFEKKYFSQHAEDGVTLKLTELLYDNPKNKYYVEFGVENGDECNTRVLREKSNWTGLLMDGSHENAERNLKKEFITKDNILSLFGKYNVPKHINLLCVDIDYNDYYCLAPILKNYTCDIIILEYNGTHLPSEDKVVQYGESLMWDRTNYFGASLLAFHKLCMGRGYTLVYCDTSGTNAYFVRNALLKERGVSIKNMGNIEAIYRVPTYGSGPNGGHPADEKNRPYLTSDSANALL